MARSKPKPKAKLPVPTARSKAAFVRLYNDYMAPERMYYSTEQAAFVRKGEPYTVWSIADWESRFGGGSKIGEPGRISEKDYIDGEGRHWEFFGYTIPLYDDNEKT